MNKILALDIETTKNSPRGFAANPHYSGNWIVSLGMKYSRGDVSSYKDWYFNSPDEFYDKAEEIIKIFEWADVIVAHHATFDLGYLWYRLGERFRDEVLPTKHVWCTMTALWWISGQTKGFVKLDEAATMPGVGGTVKEGEIPLQVADPEVPTESIDRKGLLEYQRADVVNCFKTFQAQVKWAKERKMFAFVLMRCDSLLVTLEMECQGLNLDVRGAKQKKVEVAKRVGELELLLKGTMSKYFNPWFWPHMNPASDEQISAVLFGGSYKATLRSPAGGYKGAKVYTKSQDKRKRSRKMLTQKLEKFSNREVVEYTKGMALPPTEATKKEGVFSCSEGELKKNKDIEFVEDLLEWRMWAKDHNTYYDGYINLVYPDGMLRSSYMHTVARTGRLSSRAPNLQNISSSNDD